MKKRGQLPFSASFIPESAPSANVVWSVTAEDGTATSLATIDTNGLLSALGAGTVKVTATADDGSGVTGDMLITITSSGSTGGSGSSGGSGSGSGSGSGTSASTETAAGSIKQSLTADAEGKAVADLKSDDVTKAMESAEKGTLKVDLSASADVKAVEVKLPAQTLLTSEKVKSVEVATGLATVRLDAGWFKKHVGDTSAQVELSVTKADTASLSDQAKELIGASDVYDFSLSVDGQKAGRFNGDVEVAIDYDLQPGQNPNSVVVYYLNDNGTLEVVTNGKYNAATGKVEFRPAHFSKYAAAYTPVSFSDLAQADWAKSGIEALAARQIVDGMEEGVFAPGGQVTRAQFLKMLMQAFDLKDDTAVSSLSDVQAGDWYYSAVASAEKLGIVEGKADHTFGVNDAISREDMAVMVYRAAKQLGLQLDPSAAAASFADKGDISAYAVDAVEAMQRSGIIQGTSAETFEPQGQATRAQAAVMIYRLYLQQ
ncbi:S-layer homology domain-containing protein [Paenibacillus hexagrammi]|uniref:S-layer homology domain-containing protein n=1 Tax=Paenibacillus hexagrammi TaxID=2908839 RepID=A0ABY3SRK1_9BACL|nr:S-layer homology domain-containing protein [Paenibacillus sp. YPD9-1]